MLADGSGAVPPLAFAEGDVFHFGRDDARPRLLKLRDLSAPAQRQAVRRHRKGRVRVTRHGPVAGLGLLV